MQLLAGDIGGTKALLRLIEVGPDGVSSKLIGQQRYLCKEFDSLEEVVDRFLSDLEVDNMNRPVQQACFGLPGPVSSRTVQLTNLPWVVDADQIEQACSISNVLFINDFFAAARGVETLAENDYELLVTPNKSFNYGELPSGNRLVIGAGTGLGVAPVCYCEGCYHPVASEGGHFEFAPISDTQQCLLKWLWSKWEHVSYERLLSGPGLEVLYTFFQLCDCPNSFSEDQTGLLKKNWLNGENDCQNGAVLAELESKNSLKMYTAVQVYEAAEQGEPAAVKALTEFVTIYGTFIGAAALIWNAPGGIYLAGGIASKIIPWMRKPYFYQAYTEKGRMSKLVNAFPVYLITDDDLGVKGAMQQNLVHHR
ncbi:MAG: glucokinase [Pseudomonadota bacterium]|nr:glucokinase [Pseudomonadota bacterium]